MRAASVGDTTARRRTSCGSLAGVSNGHRPGQVLHPALGCAVGGRRRASSARRRSTRCSRSSRRPWPGTAGSNPDGPHDVAELTRNESHCSSLVRERQQGAKGVAPTTVRGVERPAVDRPCSRRLDGVGERTSTRAPAVHAVAQVLARASGPARRGRDGHDAPPRPASGHGVPVGPRRPADDQDRRPCTNVMPDDRDGPQSESRQG